jgi:hypothetical protein
MGEHASFTREEHQKTQRSQQNVKTKCLKAFYSLALLILGKRLRGSPPIHKYLSINNALYLNIDDWT